MNQSLNTCPYCRESIKQNAKKCLHCGEYLEKGWFGFRKKSLRDFLSLFIVPFILGFFGFMFALYQIDFEQKREAIRAAAAADLQATRSAAAVSLEATRAGAAADLQAITEANRVNASILEQYLNDMSDIFLVADLTNENVRTVVRSRTVAVVNDLDAERNAIIIRFLQEGDVLNWVFNGTDLSGSDLEEADLTGVNFSGAILSEANLSSANLSRANLSRAYLFRTDLSFANLSRANLSRAYLFRADLSRANLFRANLSEANLSKTTLFSSGLQANLSQANLSDANLTGANLASTNRAYSANLSGTNLSGANLSSTNLLGVTYDALTRWPDGFDPDAAGAQSAGATIKSTTTG